MINNTNFFNMKDNKQLIKLKKDFEIKKIIKIIILIKSAYII